MSKSIHTVRKLQDIADDKYLSELRDGADIILTAKDRECDVEKHMRRGVTLARAAGSQQIFLVTANEAEGETWFFFFAQSAGEVENKLKAMQDI